MWVALGFGALVLMIFLAPDKLGKLLKRKGKKYAKRFIRKQINHEIKRFKFW